MVARAGSSEVSLPPGFRFCPTDSELLSYWLTSKVHGPPLTGNYISDEDILASGPEVIANKLRLEDGISYFFYECSKKYPNGTRANRATELGYYKATGKDRLVFDDRTKVKLGSMKTLVYYSGRAPSGSKTSWVVHEYKLERANHTEAEGYWVLCKLSQKKRPGTSTPPLDSDVSSPTCFITTPSPTTTPLTRSLTEDFEAIGDEFEEEEEEVDYQSIGNDVLAALGDLREDGEDGEAGEGGLGGWLSGDHGLTHMDLLMDHDLAPQVEPTEMQTPAGTWLQQQDLVIRDPTPPPPQMRDSLQEASASLPTHHVLEYPSFIAHLLTESTPTAVQMEEIFGLESDSMGFRGGDSREAFELDVFASDSLPVFAEDSKNFLAADDFLQETSVTSLHAWTNEATRTPETVPAGQGAQLALQEDSKPFSWPTLLDNGGWSSAFKFGANTSQPGNIQPPQEVRPMPRQGSSGSQDSGGGSLTDSRGSLGLGEGVAERLKMMFERRTGGEGGVLPNKRWRQGLGEKEGDRGLGGGGGRRRRVGSGQQGTEEGSVAELAEAFRGAPGGVCKARLGEEGGGVRSFRMGEDTAERPGFASGEAREARQNEAHQPTSLPLPSSYTSPPAPTSIDVRMRGLTGVDCREAEASDDPCIQSSASFWFDASSSPPDASEAGGVMGLLDGLEDRLWGSELWAVTGHGIPGQGGEGPPGDRREADRFVSAPGQQREGLPMRMELGQSAVTCEVAATRMASTPGRANGRAPPGHMSVDGSCARSRPRGKGVLMSVLATAAVYMMGDHPALPAHAVEIPGGRSVRLAGRLTEAPAGRFRGVVTMKEERCEMCESQKGGWGQVADSGWSGWGGREGGQRGIGEGKGERQDGKLRSRDSALSLGFRWGWWIGAAGLFLGVTHLFLGGASQ